MLDAHAKVGKSSYNKVPSTIINAQTDKNVDLKRLGIMLKNNIERLRKRRNRNRRYRK